MGSCHQDGRDCGNIAHCPLVAVDLALEARGIASVTEAASDRAFDLARISARVSKIHEPIRSGERGRQCMFSACDGRSFGQFVAGMPGAGAQ